MVSLPGEHRDVIAEGPRIGRGALLDRLRNAIQSGRDAVQHRRHSVSPLPLLETNHCNWS